MLGFLDWLLIGAGVLLGLKFLSGDKEEFTHVPDPSLAMARGPIRHKIQPGDVIYPQNFSPYAYEPDGNYM